MGTSELRAQIQKNYLCLNRRVAVKKTIIAKENLFTRT